MKRNRMNALAIMGLLIMATLAIATPAEAYTYNRQGAVDYARANAYNDVPGSSYFRNNGGDCTNFISQSLYNGGGMRQVVNSQNPALSWFYNGYYAGQYSPSWAGVQPFGNFVIASGRGTEVLFATGTYYLPGTVPIKIGDIIQMDGADGSVPDGIWDHTMIITRVYTVQGFKLFDVTYHSTDHLDRPLSEVFNDHPSAKFRALLLKDTYSY